MAIRPTATLTRPLETLWEGRGARGTLGRATPGAVHVRGDPESAEITFETILDRHGLMVFQGLSRSAARPKRCRGCLPGDLPRPDSPGRLDPWSRLDRRVALRGGPGGSRPESGVESARRGWIEARSVGRSTFEDFDSRRCAASLALQAGHANGHIRMGLIAGLVALGMGRSPCRQACRARSRRRILSKPPPASRGERSANLRAMLQLKGTWTSPQTEISHINGVPQPPKH